MFAGRYGSLWFRRFGRGELKGYAGFVLGRWAFEAQLRRRPRDGRFSA